MELSRGDTFAGYRIERELGRGGMGVVYLAEELSLSRRVALKVISPVLATDALFQRRFQQEARAAAAIDHPNVVPIYARGIERDHPFIAMRFVDGTDLGERLREEGPLDPVDGARIAAQVGAALDAAHAKGLIHRDVKPANILISGDGGDGHAYLGDFGLTKDMASGSRLTDTGRWVGTVDYVAPEQIEGGVVDARTDVYALTCVLFEMLSGRVPFGGQDAQKMWSHMHHEAPALDRPDLAQAFDPVIARGMAKQQEDRYPSAGDLGRAALAAATGESVTVAERSVATGVALAGLAPPGAHDPSRQPTEVLRTPRGTEARREPAKTSGGNRAWVAGGVLAALVLGVGAGAFAITSLDGDEQGSRDRNGSGERNAQSEQPDETTTAPGDGAAGSLAPRRYRPYVPSDPSYDYFAEIPAGNGWGSPVESRPTGGALLRTTVRGPQGALLIIDRTPDDIPEIGAGFDSSRVVSHPQFGSATEYILSSSESIPECSGRPCVDYLFEDGRGGGWGVLAGGPNQALAAEVAARVAFSVSE